MANTLTIDCGERGCKASEPMAVAQEKYHFELIADKRPMSVTVTKSEIPIGWGYVKVHRFVSRPFCTLHKEAANIRETENLARAGANVKQPVKRAYRRVR